MLRLASAMLTGRARKGQIADGENCRAHRRGKSMRLPLIAALLAMPLSAVLAQGGAERAVVEKPAALIADGIPPVPAELAARARPYMEYRSAGFSGWNAHDRSMLIT